MDKNYLIKKWLANTLSEEEMEAFKKMGDYDLYNKLNQKAKNFKASNFIIPTDFDTIKERIASRPKKLNIFSGVKNFMRFAAVLLIAFGVYFTFFSNDLTRIETLAGKKTTALLPDASEVTLNAVSEIQYNIEKWHKKRELKLSGEAYFKVAKGSLFDVLTDAGKISVLGTQFNVKNRKGYFEVICYKGSVGVTYKGKTEKLSPGQVFRVLRGEISTDIVNVAQPFWLQNESYFTAVPFYEVIQELERQYGVKVNAKSVDIQHVFNGGFVHGDLEMALESITRPLGLVYVIESTNTVVLKNSE
jgi:ferric-dicitrate binding protein FerR (iron transport regulator)